MTREMRNHLRFEPGIVHSTFIINSSNASNKPFVGRVLDASVNGLAIDIPFGTKEPEVGKEGRLSISKNIERIERNRFPIGKAMVARKWSDSDNEAAGFALQLEKSLSNPIAEKLLLSGKTQEERLKGQDTLAEQDINNLEAERRYLVDCQMKLFVLMLTIGVAFSGAYFGLAYHGMAINQFKDPQLSFWRTLIAALPGFLSIACAFMSAQKSASIQRIDAFLVILKNCRITKQYPREYKGWESAYRKLRFIWKSDKCKDNFCGVKECGELSSDERTAIKSVKILKNPVLNLFNVIIFSTFFAILALSLTTVLVEIIGFQRSIPFYMVIASFLTFIIIALCGGLIWYFREIGKGRFSFYSNMRIFKDLLNKCPYQL